MEDNFFIWGLMCMYCITAITSIGKLLDYFLVRIEAVSSYRLMHLWKNGSV